MDRISELPLEILQRIVYHLSQKEAVRTSVLSKSWRHIGSTRPNLDFSYTNLKECEFLIVVDQILQRYYDERLVLEEFHLSIYSCHESVWLVEKWIPLLTTMGLKKFGLSIRLGSILELPPEVFGANSLQHLHLANFMLDRETVERILPCKHLRSLCLEQVYIEDEILQEIISGSPLIETMSVEGNCQRLATTKLNDPHNLKNFSLFVREVTQLCSIEIYPPSPETINISDVISMIYQCGIWFRKGADFCNLKELYLEEVNSSVLEHLSLCKFPGLECLTLIYCDGLEESHILIDAPKIRNFEYSGRFVPSISFATTSSEWKSDIYIQNAPTDDGPSWFLELKELLKSLSKSEISLRIACYYDDIFQENILVQDDDYSKPIVESLNLKVDLSSLSGLVNGLFAICRPRHICTICTNHHNQQIEYVGFLSKILMDRENGKHVQFTQSLLRDLEEVSLEMKEDDQEKWDRATFADFLLNSYYGGFNFRFALKWRQTL